MTEITSKPKIHRMPSLPPEGAPGTASDNIMMVHSLWVFGILSVFIVIFALYQIFATPSAGTIAQVATVPETQSDSTIYIKDDNGVIAGQMAKIPPEHEKVTAIKNIADINQPAGRDLLAIISKY